MVSGWLFAIVYLTAGIIISTAYFKDNPDTESLWLRMFIMVCWFPVAVTALILIMIKGR